MNDRNFNALKHIEVPENWIENAIALQDSPQIRKKSVLKMPFVWGTAASLVLAVALSVYMAVMLGGNGAPTAPAAPVAPITQPVIESQGTEPAPTSTGSPTAPIAKPDGTAPTKPSGASERTNTPNQPNVQNSGGAVDTSAPSNQRGAANNTGETRTAEPTHTATQPATQSAPKPTVPVQQPTEPPQPQTEAPTIPDFDPQAPAPDATFPNEQGDPSADPPIDEPFTGAIIFYPQGAFEGADSVYCTVETPDGQETVIFGEPMDHFKNVRRPFFVCYPQNSGASVLLGTEYTVTFTDDNGNVTSYRAVFTDNSNKSFE